MTQTELIKRLKIVDCVVINYGCWNIVMQIVALIQSDQAKIIQYHWINRFKYSKTDLTKIETWSTYETCVDLEFKYEDKSLICHTTIWDGDILNGYRTQKRFTATIKLPLNFILQIQGAITASFQNFLAELYDDYLDSLKSQWIEQKSKELLK